MRSYVLTTTVALAWGMIGSQGAFAEEDAELYLQRFLSHMKQNAPIAGTFEMRTELDKEIYERRSGKLEGKVESGAATYSLEPRVQLLQSRWAWDGVRELHETFPGSEGVQLTFFSGREGKLSKINESLYQLEHRRFEPKYRPASFYSLTPSGHPWWDLLVGKETRLEPQPPGSPPNSILIVINDGLREWRMLIDRSSGILHGYEVIFRGKKAVELRVQELAKSPTDSRVIPKSAYLHVYTSSVDERPYRMQFLTAKQVRFPKTREDTNRELTLRLPSGAKVADQTLKKVIELPNEVTARSLVEGALDVSDFSSPLKENPIVVANPPEDSSFWGRWWWVGLIVVVALGVLLLMRVRHRLANDISST